jgi:uncharacterized protein
MLRREVMARSSGKSHSVLWRRLDQPGHDAAWLVAQASGWQLAGSAVFSQDGQPVRLEYSIDCNAGWQSLRARVRGWMGSLAVELELTADEARRWRLNGVECPAVAGCLDVDLSFTPATNLLPIRRLELATGRSAEVRAAWLAFPNLTLEPLEQCYRRTGPATYHYESNGGEFQRELEVNPAGFVTLYPGLWQAEASAG